jgi:hypothetical protein
MEKMRMHKKMAMSGQAPSMKKYKSGGMAQSSKRDEAKTTFNKKNYKLGLKMQGDYKGKNLKGKAKEFVKTAVKQTKGTVSEIFKKKKTK